MMLNTNCCCDKKENCSYDIAFLITEEKVSVNAPIVATPSVSFYIQQFLGFSGASLSQYIKEGPIEGQKENTPLYKEIYETLTGKTFDGKEGCCKDPNYYFIDQDSIVMSVPGYLGTHHRDEKEIFYAGNRNSNGKYLNSLVKQTLILPEKYKDYDHPDLTTFSEVSNLEKIQTNNTNNGRPKSLLKNAFSRFFKTPNNNVYYNNYVYAVSGDDIAEPIGYYYNGIMSWVSKDITRTNETVKDQPKLMFYYVDPPVVTDAEWSPPGPICNPVNPNPLERWDFSALSKPVMSGGTAGRGILQIKEISFDRSQDGMQLWSDTYKKAFDNVYSDEKEKANTPIYNKIPVYFPPSDSPDRNIGYTLSVQYTKNLPVFFGPEEDTLLHYNGLTLGFVNSIVPITYKLNIDEIVKSVKLSKKLININEIRGYTLQFKQSGNSSFTNKSFSSDTVGYLRYLNKSDMIADQEIERVKSRYYRYKNLYKTFLEPGYTFEADSFFRSDVWESLFLITGLDYKFKSLFNIELKVHEFCSSTSYGSTEVYGCIDYPPNELKYINDFNYEGPCNLQQKLLPDVTLNSDFNMKESSYFFYKNYFIYPNEEYKTNTTEFTSKRVNQNINDYFHHGIYFDLNKTFQLKKLWETHLSYYWGGFAVHDALEPNIDNTEGSEHRYIKYVYPVVTVNKALCQAKADPQAWSVYFTVHDDVQPNNQYFEQYFWLNSDSYVKSKTLLSKYQENIKLSIKVLRILKDTTPYQLSGVQYSDKDKKRIKFIDTEYTVPDTISEQDNIDTNNIQMDPYEFLNPLNETKENSCDLGLVQNQNTKIKENQDTNNVILFEETHENNTFYDKRQNKISFSDNLNDNLTLAPWSEDNRDPGEIGSKMKIILTGVENWKQASNNGEDVVFYIGKTYTPDDWSGKSNGTWDFGGRTNWNSTVSVSNYFTANNRAEMTTLIGRELNLPLITGYVGEKVSGKQIVIPYLKYNRSTSVSYTKNDTSWKQKYTPIVKYGPRVFQSEYNIDINDTSVATLNSYLLLEPPIISPYNKSGKGLYKNNIISYTDYKNQKQTDLFEEWKHKTLNDLYLQRQAEINDPIHAVGLCSNKNLGLGGCDKLIQDIESTTISDKLYFINPICRKNNFNFEVKTILQDESYIRSYDSLLNNYKIGGVYGPENGIMPYLNNILYPSRKESGNIIIHTEGEIIPTEGIVPNRTGIYYPINTSGPYYGNSIQNLKNLLCKNIDIGANSLNSNVYPVSHKLINTNIETIPPEINLYQTTNNTIFSHIMWKWGLPNQLEYKLPNVKYSNYYPVNTTPTGTDVRKSLKLVYNATSMNSNYANIELFKKITSSNYYCLFSSEYTEQPIAQIDGKKKYPSNDVLKEYIIQKSKGTLSLENEDYIIGYCKKSGNPDCDKIYETFNFGVHYNNFFSYPNNFGGLVLDTDTYAFKYDITTPTPSKIAFMLWNANVDFGQFNDEWINLRNSYLPANNQTYKNGWLIKKNQPDQFFIDNLLESIQEQYIEYQYYEQFILSLRETIDKLNDYELYCITTGVQNTKKEIGIGIINNRPFERAISISGPGTLPGNSDLISSLKKESLEKAPCFYASTPGPSETYTQISSYSTDVLRYFPTVNIEKKPVPGGYRDQFRIEKQYYISAPVPEVKRMLYDYNDQGKRAWIDITNTFPVKQTSTVIDVPSVLPRTYRGWPYNYLPRVWRTKITTEDNIITGSSKWFFNANMREFSSKALLLNALEIMLAKKREPFTLLEQLFGTIDLSDDTVNEKNLKKMSKQVTLQKHYSITRLEKTKSISINYTIPRFLGIHYQKINTISSDAYNNPTLKRLITLKDYIYFKDSDFIEYKSSSDYWPNIKSIDVYSPNLAKIKTNSIKNYTHFLKGLLVSQQFDYHQSKNTLSLFNDNEQSIRQNTQLFDYNFYRDEGYYLDLSKDYEVYLPQLPVTCKYDALPSYGKRTETAVVKSISSSTSYPVQYVIPTQIIYTNLSKSFDLSAVDPEAKHTINNTYYKVVFPGKDETVQTNIFYDLKTYTINAGIPPMEFNWIKPEGFVLKSIPFNSIKMVVKSSLSTTDYYYYDTKDDYQVPIQRLAVKAFSDPVLGDDRICYDGDCEKWGLLFSSSQIKPDLTEYNNTLNEKYTAYYNGLSSYNVYHDYKQTYFYSWWGDQIDPYFTGDRFAQKDKNKIAYGDIFNCLATIKFASTKIIDHYYDAGPALPYDPQVNDSSYNYAYDEVYFGNKPDMEIVRWTDYRTFTRPKIQVKGIPNSELKLIDFSSVFKDKHLINDILYPLYGNFGKK